MNSGNTVDIQVEFKRIVLDHTPLISLPELITQINNICDQVEDEIFNSVVVQSSGVNSFAANTWPGQVDVQTINRWEKAVRRLEQLPAMIVAVVSGCLSGSALDLFLASDYRIATTDFKLRIAINNGYTWSGMAIHRLVNQIGMGRCRQLVMHGREMTAQQALEISLIDEISNDAFNSVPIAIPQLNAIAGSEISIRRRLLSEACTSPFEDALGVHLAACDRELRRLYSGPLE